MIRRVGQSPLSNFISSFFSSFFQHHFFTIISSSFELYASPLIEFRLVKSIDTLVSKKNVSRYLVFSCLFFFLHFLYQFSNVFYSVIFWKSFHHISYFFQSDMEFYCFRRHVSKLFLVFFLVCSIHFSYFFLGRSYVFKYFLD